MLFVGNSSLDTHDGGTPASRVWTSRQSFIGGIQVAFKGTSLLFTLCKFYCCCYLFLFIPTFPILMMNMLRFYDNVASVCLPIFFSVSELFVWCLQFLGNLRNLRDSYAALAVGSSETIAGEPSSVTRIISECESALTFLNRDLGILTSSIARERGEEVNLRWKLLSQYHQCWNLWT